MTQQQSYQPLRSPFQAGERLHRTQEKKTGLCETAAAHPITHLQLGAGEPWTPGSKPALFPHPPFDHAAHPNGSWRKLASGPPPTFLLFPPLELQHHVIVAHLLYGLGCSSQRHSTRAGCSPCAAGEPSPSPTRC